MPIMHTRYMSIIHQSHLLTHWVKKIPEHQPSPVRLRIGHRNESHVVSDLPLDAEGMSQRKICPVRLDGPVVLCVAAAAAATVTLVAAAKPTATPHRFQKVFIDGTSHDDGWHRRRLPWRWPSCGLFVVVWLWWWCASSAPPLPLPLPLPVAGVNIW